VTVAVSACGGDNTPPLGPNFSLSNPNVPFSGDGIASKESFEICKTGSGATFAYTVLDKQTGIVLNKTITLASGECQVIASYDGVGAVVTVTETAPQSGYQLSHVDITTVTGGPGVHVEATHTESGPTVKDSTGGGVFGRGVLARFFNEPIPAGSIGDFVWDDLNGNGVQDVGEPGLPGVTVTLGGAASATTTTDANGAYLFSGLAAGSYTVSVGTPAGFTTSPSNQGGDPLKDSNGSPASVTLATNTNSDLSIDFGFVPPPPPPEGQIGDYVWEDVNGDGIQDASETGISGLTVTLTGPVNAATTTDANGGYLFSNLPAGNYTVTVATPAGFSASPSNQGGDPNEDSNDSPASVSLPTSSSVNLSIDFGFIPPNGLGRMTGGGVQIEVNGVRISRGLTLHCDIVLSNNLEVNWPMAGSKGTNNFHITRPLTSARCLLDPAFSQPPPVAPFNTFIGVAQGTLNGIPGATARFVFIDAGEPGRNDRAQLQIWNAAGQLVLDIPMSNLDHGNLQAHYDQPHGNKP